MWIQRQTITHACMPDMHSTMWFSGTRVAFNKHLDHDAASSPGTLSPPLSPRQSTCSYTYFLQFFSGPQEGESKGSAFMSSGNAERLADALCRMRGAALKLGQMLSIQDENMMPPQVLLTGCCSADDFIQSMSSNKSVRFIT